MFGGVILEELSFFEKLLVLWDNILDHPLFIILFFIPILLFFLQKKHGKNVFIISYFLAIFILLISFGDIIFKLFDNLMDGLFMLLYFPNFISLFFIVVTSSLIVLVCLFSKNVNKISKAINYIAFGLIQSLFALILIIVRVHKVNIYKANSLYTDKDVLALMQLLTFVFTVQIISNIIIHIINKGTAVLDNKANFSRAVSKQIINLSKGKIKSFQIDNNKVGYINVADKTTTSKPILKPFKFDIEKLQSVTIDVPKTSKSYTPYSIAGTEFSYANEVIPVKFFKPFNINSNIPFYLNVVSKPYKNFYLKDLNVTYLNEVIVSKKYRIIILDSSKFLYLNVPKKYYKLFKLDGRDFSYLNEVVKKYRPAFLDSSKFLYLDAPKKAYNLFKLDDKDVTYLNEVVKKPLVTLSTLNPNKDITIDVPDKGYRIAYIDPHKDISMLSSDKTSKKISIKDKVTNYISGVVKKYKPSNFEPDVQVNYSEDLSEPIELTANDTAQNKFINENKKPDLLQIHNEDLEYNVVSEPMYNIPVAKPKNNLVDNLRIIDIQSMLDVAVKYHFMKGVNLYTYNKITVNNLRICNYKLLLDILKVYKLFK